MIPWLDVNDPFPPADYALREPNGLLAAGADLSPNRLINAYSRGIFPWFNEGEPILWWSPDPRMVLFPDELKISRSLRKILKKNDYDIRVDTAFHKVLKGCASPRSKQLETWITAPMMTAYHNLHRMGLAHSVEVWKDGKLTGGLYGVALGKMFFGESMFSAVPNSSKVALVHLVWQLRRWSFGMIDCQVNTEHLASLGAREIPRRDFTQRLNELVNYPGINSRWVFAHGLAE